MKQENLNLDVIIENVLQNMNNNIMENIKKKFAEKEKQLYCNFESYREIANEQEELVKNINNKKYELFKEEIKSILSLVIKEIMAGKTLYAGIEELSGQFLLVSKDEINNKSSIKESILEDIYVNLDNLSQENIVKVLSHNKWFWSHSFENANYSFSKLIIKQLTESVLKEDFNKYVKNKKKLSDIIIGKENVGPFDVASIYSEKVYNESVNKLKEDLLKLNGKEKSFLAEYRNIFQANGSDFFSDIIEDRLATRTTIIIPFMNPIESYDLNNAIEEIEYQDYISNSDEGLLHIDFERAVDNIGTVELQEKFLKVINENLKNKEMYPHLTSMLYLIRDEMRHKIDNFESHDAVKLLTLNKEMFETFKNVINEKDLVQYITSSAINSNNSSLNFLIEFVNKGLLKYKNEYRKDLVIVCDDVQAIIINNDLLKNYGFSFNRFNKIAKIFNEKNKHTSFVVDETCQYITVEFNRGENIKYSAKELSELSDLAFKTIMLLGDSFMDIDDALEKEGAKYREKYLSYKLQKLNAPSYQKNIKRKL